MLSEKGEIMQKNKYSGYKQLYSDDSLETYLSIKGTLETNGIPYADHAKGESILSFFYRLFVIGVGSLGLTSERTVHYSIYVREQDYPRALTLIV